MTTNNETILSYQRDRDAKSDAAAEKKRREGSIESAEKTIFDQAFSIATKGLGAACGMTKASAKAIKPLIGVLEVGRGLYGATKALATIFNEEQKASQGQQPKAPEVADNHASGFMGLKNAVVIGGASPAKGTIPGLEAAN